MAWFLDTVRVYVEKDSGWQTTPRVGEVNVLDSNETIIHCAGRPSYTRDITFVVFSGYFTNILPLATCSVSGIALVSDQGAEGSIVIKNLKPDRLYDRSRTTPVYRVTMSCIKVGT